MKWMNEWFFDVIHGSALCTLQIKPQFAKSVKQWAAEQNYFFFSPKSAIWLFVKNVFHFLKRGNTFPRSIYQSGFSKVYIRPANFSLSHLESKQMDTISCLSFSWYNQSLLFWKVEIDHGRNLILPRTGTVNFCTGLNVRAVHIPDPGLFSSPCNL